MHLLSPQHLAASSGIVGASGPAGVGFALAAQHLRPGSLAVAFFGDGAMNQGMMMEAMNLAVAWKLALLFVCKDNAWAVTTRSSSVTGGSLANRARCFGMPSIEVDGGDVKAVWHAARELIESARNGRGPAFLQAHCPRLEGHLLGDQLLRIARREKMPEVGQLLRAVTRTKGTSPKGRAKSVADITSLIRQATEGHGTPGSDPLQRTRQELTSDVRHLEELEDEVKREIQRAVEEALQPPQAEEGIQ